VTLQKGKSGESISGGGTEGIANVAGHNSCRAVHDQHLFKVDLSVFASEKQNYIADYFPPFLSKHGTGLCFVNASDPRVHELTDEAGERFKRKICPKVQLLPCGLHRCKVREIHHLRFEAKNMQIFDSISWASFTSTTLGTLAGMLKKVTGLVDCEYLTRRWIPQSMHPYLEGVPAPHPAYTQLGMLI
jgi:hypothetical protein